MIESNIPGQGEIQEGEETIRAVAYIINLDVYELIETHWIAFYVNDDNGSASYNATYFDSFGVEYIPK